MITPETIQFVNDVLALSETLCIIRIPQFRDGLVDKFLYHEGFIDTETWVFKGDKHDINFKTEDNFKKHLVKYL